MTKIESFYAQKYPCVTKPLRKHGEKDRLTP